MAWTADILANKCDCRDGTRPCLKKGIPAPHQLVAITKYCRVGGSNHKHLFLTVLEAVKAQDPRCLQIRCLMRACFLAYRSCFPLVSSCGRDSRGSGCFLISERHQLHQIGPPRPHDLTYPDYLTVSISKYTES